MTACAVCDGAAPIFRNKDLYVFGGGDTAVEEAVFLTKFGQKVYLVHRRDELRASKIMAERALKHPKIEVIWNHVLEKVEGDHVVSHVILKDVNSGKEMKREAGGVFFLPSGTLPQYWVFTGAGGAGTHWLPESQAGKDSHKYRRRFFWRRRCPRPLSIARL